MRNWLLVALPLLSTSASAQPQSPVGATPLRTDVHHIFMGWPSLGYEYWRPGSPDWGIGGELVYGEWWGGGGGFPDIGMAFNMGFRFPMIRQGKVDMAFKLKPGAMIGGEFHGHGGRFNDDDDHFVAGFRGEMGLPVSIKLTPMVSLITGGSFPVTVAIIDQHGDNVDTFVVIPIYPRIGVDVLPTSALGVWFLAEFGPAIGCGDGGCDVDLGFRVWLGLDVY